MRITPRICILEVRDRKNLDGSPVAWLLVEREETYYRNERDESVYAASIRLSYERILPKHSHHLRGKGWFSGGYSQGGSKGSSVSLTSESTSKGAVFLDLPGLQGQRIGTYLMNQIVIWAQQWPAAEVRSVELMLGQADQENKSRRNRFYERFNLKFEYSDSEQREGISKPMRVEALTLVDSWKENILECDVREYFGEMLYEHESAKTKLIQSARANKVLQGEIKRAEDNPIRWALRRVWWRVAPFLFVSATVLILCLVTWASVKPR